MRRLVWIATALVLAGALLVVPRLNPVRGVDPFPAHVDLHERATVNGGSVRIDKVTVAPVWTDGDEKISLKKQHGLFVEVRATGRPDRKVDVLRASIRAGGRTFTKSDRAGESSLGGPAGFDTPVAITFELPADAVEDGAVWVGFTDDSSARFELDSKSVTRVAVLEQDE